MNHYWDEETDVNFEYNHLQNDVLFEQGITWLVNQGMIEELPDIFGPTVYRPSDGLNEGWYTNSEDRGSPFYKYNALPFPNGWLKPALKRLNEAFTELGVTEDDFNNPDAEWEPLPLDRKDESLQNAIAALDDAIREIRADNGYAANFPEERNFVVDALDAASKKLKSAQTICVPYLRQYVIQPLTLVLQRFKGAALSIVSTAAREAMIEFVKTNGGRLLDLLIKNL